MITHLFPPCKENSAAAGRRCRSSTGCAPTSHEASTANNCGGFGVLQRIHRHLGVASVALPHQEAVISWRSIPETGTAVPETAIPRQASPEINAALRELYRAEIQTLEAMLGWDCSDWLEEGLA